MKRLFYLLIVCLFFFSSESISMESSEKQINLTDKQLELVQKIRNMDGFLKVKWSNTFSLDIIVDPSYYGFLSKSESEEFAQSLANYGYTYIGKNVCIKISDPKQGELAYKCIGDQTGT